MKSRQFPTGGALPSFQHPRENAKFYDSPRFAETRSRVERICRQVAALDLVKRIWRVAVAIDAGAPDRAMLYFLVVPALFFRLFPLLFTHNSTPLCAYLAVVLVYIPARVVRTAWQAYKSLVRGMQRAKDDGKSSRLHLWRASEHSHFSSSPPRGVARRWSSFRIPRRLSFPLWVCGAIITAWAYTRGIASPFPTATSVISASPTLMANQARNATYYISTTFWNNDAMFDAWASETLKLIDILGRPNVYISMTENDSEDHTPAKLRKFGAELAKRHVMHNVNITTGIREEPLEDPWRSVRHRVGYMTNLRNGALQALEDVDKRFDVVVLLNDIVYHHTDVLKLVAALGSDDVRKSSAAHVTLPKRRMACGLDMDGATLYDAWVLQDRCGRPITGFWPFFWSEEDKQAVREGRVLEVGTCWNGIAVLDGDMFLEKQLRSGAADWDAEPLRFHEQPECIISECALLPLRITNTTGGAPIVVDPTVVVAYSHKWWNYYAVWLRMPVVRLWMRVFEERYWDLWWRMGMGEGLRWKGLDDGREKDECGIRGWPRCDTTDVAAKGGLRFTYHGATL